eukprot:gb/GFBE01072176.1/.p1 GENE.gb/GFBE01072176.1/~~gb/GFBE01072176.1/.p1  ORF type:complete len:141 (+),score=20.59 gb/GFBE01072176.1/:1-423(+)
MATRARPSVCAAAAAFSCIAICLTGCSCKAGGVERCTQQYEAGFDKISQKDAGRGDPENLYAMCDEISRYANCVHQEGCCEELLGEKKMREHIDDLERERWGTCKKVSNQAAQLVNLHCYGDNCEEIARNPCPGDSSVLT